MARKKRPRRPRVHRPRHPDAVNVVQVGVGRNRLGDLYHFFIDSSWPALLLTICGIFVSGNALFALAYLACGNCIKNAHPGSFLDAFFFSVQTMATIGYGEMVPATVIANLLVLVEVLTGLIGVAMV